MPQSPKPLRSSPAKSFPRWKQPPASTATSSKAPPGAFVVSGTCDDRNDPKPFAPACRSSSPKPRSPHSRPRLSCSAATAGANPGPLGSMSPTARRPPPLPRQCSFAFCRSPMILAETSPVASLAGACCRSGRALVPFTKRELYTRLVALGRGGGRAHGHRRRPIRPAE